MVAALKGLEWGVGVLQEWQAESCYSTRAWPGEPFCIGSEEMGASDPCSQGQRVLWRALLCLLPGHCNIQDWAESVSSGKVHFDPLPSQIGACAPGPCGDSFGVEWEGRKEGEGASSGPAGPVPGRVPRSSWKQCAVCARVASAGACSGLDCLPC